MEREVIEDNNTSVSKLIPTLSNKLAFTAALRAGQQPQFTEVKGNSLYVERLIGVLSSQATT